MRHAYADHLLGQKQEECEPYFHDDNICTGQLMRQIIFILLICLQSAALAQSPVRKLSFAELKAEVLHEPNAVVILNFWATWCKPCVEELPDFEKITANYPIEKVKVILANLDFHTQVDAIVPAFIQKRQLQSTVVHITDTDPDTWINAADDRWSGAIPATLVFYKGRKIDFHEGKTDYHTLDSIITNTLQP